MPPAKFRADPLKTVAVHKEQRNTHRHTHIFDFMYFIVYIRWRRCTVDFFNENIENYDVE